MNNFPPPGGEPNPTEAPNPSEPPNRTAPFSDPFSSAPPSQPPTSRPTERQPPAPAGYLPYPASGMEPAAPKSAQLLAGGIVGVVLSVFVVLIGLALTVLGGALNDFADDFGDAVILIGLVVVAFGGFGLASGIGAILRRQWGRICSIVFGAINGVLALLALVSEPDGGVVVYLAMSVAIVVLCAMGPATPA